MMEENNEDPMLVALDSEEDEDADWDEPDENLDAADDKDEEDAQFRRSVDEA